MTDRTFFFGLWRVPMYNYMWGYSAAQVELMSSDQPFVAYKKEKPAKQGGIGGVAKPDHKEMDDVVRRWQEKKKKARKMNIDDLFNGGAEKKNLLPENV